MEPAVDDTSSGQGSRGAPAPSAPIPTHDLGAGHRAPLGRAGIVQRTGLVNRLATTPEPVILVVAPPGYGKTTLLSQLAQQTGTPVAWVSCDATHHDPAALWVAVIDALAVIAPDATKDAGRRLARSGGQVGDVPGIVSSLAAIGGPLLLVLDHAEAVTSTECWTSIAEFGFRVPAGWRLAIGSRDQLPLPRARLRTQGRLAEFGPADLAMTVGEASELLRGNGVEPTAAQAEELARRTEGWPAGLYIAALTIRAGNPAAGFSFTGDDRLMRDYLRSELLPRITPAQAGFLALTSVLDRMCGPLCDAVIGGRRSAHILEELVQHNLLVVPLDRRGEWYRYHHLLRDLLLSELRRDAPELVPTLHVRAAAWYQANGMAESALEHAMAAGDTDRMARLVLEVMQPVWASGRIDTVRRWMEWLSAKPATREHAAIATHGALIFALLGRPSEAERWAAVAERLPRAGKLPDGSTVDATVAYLRANLAREGIAAMRSDSLMAFEGLSPNSPYRATMLFTEGVSHLLDGDLERADAVLAHSYDMSKAAGALPLTALALAERHLVAAERDDLASAGQYVREAVEIVDGGGFDSYWTSALVLASAARHAALQGQVAAARRQAQGAARLRPLLTYALPVVSVQALLEMARVYIALVDPEGARAVLAQTRDILQQRPRLGPLPAAATRLQSDVGQLTRTAAGGSSLTEAELRLVPLLPTHLSFPEIGERLFISRHTVKTHAISLYRKLGVSSRSEAVARMSELGMHSG